MWLFTSSVTNVVCLLWFSTSPLPRVGEWVCMCVCMCVCVLRLWMLHVCLCASTIYHSTPFHSIAKQHITLGYRCHLHVHVLALVSIIQHIPYTLTFTIMTMYIIILACFLHVHTCISWDSVNFHWAISQVFPPSLALWSDASTTHLFKQFLPQLKTLNPFCFVSCVVQLSRTAIHNHKSVPCYVHVYVRAKQELLSSHCYGIASPPRPIRS